MFLTKQIKPFFFLTKNIQNKNVFWPMKQNFTKLTDTSLLIKTSVLRVLVLNLHHFWYRKFYTKIPGIPYIRSKVDIVVSERFKVSTKTFKSGYFLRRTLLILTKQQTTMQKYKLPPFLAQASLVDIDGLRLVAWSTFDNDHELVILIIKQLEIPLPI